MLGHRYAALTSNLAMEKRRSLPFITDELTSLNDRLLFAVPKKGRLHQPCLDLLSGSDIQFHRHNRLDIALVRNLPLALIFLPAADIPTFVGEGRVDLGITGRDQVAEHEADTPPTSTTGVVEIMDLGFGSCKLQVQVPEKGDIQRSDQLVGKTVVTSFTSLSRDFFRNLEQKGAKSSAQVNGDTPSVDQKQLKTTIKYVGGSVEAACALGVADGIVDLVGKSLLPLLRLQIKSDANTALQNPVRPCEQLD
jgi:ATP phosphoribosyltransferase